MPCALEVTDKRPKNTSRMRCNGLVGNNDNCFSEDHLIHRPVYGFPDNRAVTVVLSPVIQFFGKLLVYCLFVVWQGQSIYGAFSWAQFRLEIGTIFV